MTHYSAAVCAVLMASSIGVANAQIQIELTKATSGVIAKSKTPADAQYAMKGQEVSVLISADASLTLACDKVSVTLDSGDGAGPPIPSKPRADGKCEYALSASAVHEGSNTLTIQYDGKFVQDMIITSGDPNGSTAPGSASPAVSVASLLGCNCNPGNVGTYDQGHNEARIYVTPLGRVLRRPKQEIDQDDVVHVYVCTRAKFKDLLVVERTSEFGATGTIAVAGSGLTVPAITKHAGGQEEQCGWQETVLSDFSPGKATVGISVMTKDGPSSVGSFEFGVNRNYAAAIAFGPAFLNGSAGGFKLVMRDGEQVIAEDSEGKWDAKYVLFLTPFFFSGRRDMEKKPLHWADYVNPTLGIVPSEGADHILLGLAANINLAQLSIGTDWAKEQALSEASGLEPGDAFTGTVEELPVVTKRNFRFYWSVAVDLRLATSFLGTLSGN